MLAALVVGMLLGGVGVFILMGLATRRVMAIYANAALIETATDVRQLRAGQLNKVLERKEAALPGMVMCFEHEHARYMPQEQRLGVLWAVQACYSENPSLNPPPEVKAILDGLPPRPPRCCPNPRAATQPDSAPATPAASVRSIDIHVTARLAGRQQQTRDISITQRDIRQYDWQTHTIFLRPAVAAGMLDPTGRGGSFEVEKVLGGSFVVAVDGKAIYRGALTSILSSIVPNVPMIHVGPGAGQWQPANAIRMYPPPRAGQDDPRNDAVLKQALMDLGLLKDDQDFASSAVTQPAQMRSPEETGRERAAEDIRAGKERVLYYGKPWSAGRPLIDEASGLPVEVLAGCVVTPDFAAETDAYNAVMRQWARCRPTSTATPGVPPGGP